MGFQERRLRQRLRSMPLPVPFTVEGLAANMAQLSGRSIQLVPIDAARDDDLRTACGLRARCGETTLILYRPRPTQNQTNHLILHELAHEWLGHGTTLDSGELDRLVPEPLLEDLRGRLGPNLVVQARSRFTTESEREAELSASLIKDLVRTRPLGLDALSFIEALRHYPTAPRP